RLSGTLLRLESDRAMLLTKLEAIEAKLPFVKRDLAAIDLTLAQHEIQIEPTEIRPVRPMRRKRLLAPGLLGRLLLRILREHEGWLTARDLTELVGEYIEDFELLDPRHTLARVRRRLNKLAKVGILERQRDIVINQPSYDQNGRWRLAQSIRENADTSLAAPQSTLQT
ncbi:MAG TPA: hypothetical protein VGV14_16390, partial [Rhodanobacter sp.]|nr:hypothetical protein [Rhodanobacter sp.]